MKKNWYVQTVLPWEKGELFTRESKRHCRQNVWPSSGGPKMRFVKAQHQCFWPSSGLFSSADQFLMLPSCQHTLLVSGCPKNTQLDAAGGHSAGLRSLNHPACYAPEGASSTCCLFSRTGEATWAFFLLRNVMPSFLKASVLVTVETPHADCKSWDLSQASCSWPPSGDLTRHLRACAGGLGQIVPDPAFLFVFFFYPHMTGENG